MNNDTKWVIDRSHSEIEFKVRHLMISYVKGCFKVFDATVYTRGNDFSSAQVSLWVDASSIDTGDPKRNEHLKSSEFFDVNTHTEITFNSIVAEKAQSNEFELVGDLTIKGITKRIKLDVEFGGIIKDPWGNEKAGFTVTGKINRKEWGLNWNSRLEAGGVLVGEDVTIHCDIELVRKADENKVMQAKAEEDESIKAE